jgi:hypothetical protein
MNNLEAALAFLQKFPQAKLFPAVWGWSEIQKATTHCPLVKWSTQSSSDPEQIRTWLEGRPKRYACVALAQSDMSCLDVDNKNGKNGRAELLNLELDNEDLPETMLGATPNDGDHHIFMGAMASGANKFGPGLDSAVMIPVPGSNAVGKGQYTLVKNGVVAQVPEWLKRMAGAKREKTTAAPTVDEDLEHNIERAIEYLQRAPESIQGAGGDHTAYTVACRVRELGISQNMALELMHEHYADRCSPYDVDWIEAKVENAYKYALKEPGSATADAAFKDVEVPRPPGPIRASLLDIMNTPAREWLLGKRYISKFITATVAPGGSSKSTLVMQEAMSIAMGKDICGEEILVSGQVWIANGEDPLDEIQRRMAAICMHYKLDPVEDVKNVHLTGKEFDTKFAGPGDNGQFVANHKVIKEVETFIRENGIKLWVLDPFVSCHGFPEQDNNNVNQVMKIISGICDRTNSSCAIVSHSPKGVQVSGNADAWRGASSARDASRIMDTVCVMEEKECKKFGIPETMRSWYIKRESAKANMRPPGQDLKWYKRISILLPNGKDHVGVLEYIELDEVKTVPAEDAFISAAVFSMMNDGDSKTVNAVAQVIIDERGEELGKIMGGIPSRNTISEKIISLFTNPQIDEGNIEIRFVNKKLGPSKASKYLSAKSVEEEDY